MGVNVTVISTVLTKYAVPFWRKHLQNTKYAKEYLASRAIDQSAIDNFFVGYNPFGNELIKHIRQCDGDCDLALFSNNEGMDVFGGYVVFPMLRGKIVANVTSRYVGAHEYKPLHRHLVGNMDIVFNWNALINKTIYVVESPIDAITMWIAGFNAIATNGTNGTKRLYNAITPRHTVVFIPDNDKHDQGYKAIIKHCIALWGKHIRDLYYIPCEAMGDNKDVNEVAVNHGYNTLKKIMHKNTWRYIPNNRDFIGTIGDIELREMERRIARKPHTKNDELILDVIGKHTELTQTSANRYKGICCLPDHRDTKPSLVVYIDTNSWYCFGCGRGGGVGTFKRYMK